MSFSLPANAPLLLAFGELPDPRKLRNRSYPLIDIIAVTVMGIIADANDFVSAYRWAYHRREWLISVGLCLNGVPSHDTLNRVFRLLDPKSFHECFMQWVRTIAATVEGVIAIDGKTLCNSGDTFRQTDPLHIVHAFATENSLLLGQLATNAKSNEITAIPELLKMLTVKGNVITIDAMGCQKEIVKQIREKEGDYVIALKGNQGSLHAEAENFFQQAMEVELEESGCDYISTIEKNRGRIEERQVWSCALDWLSAEQLEGWIDLKTLICVKSTRTHKVNWRKKEIKRCYRFLDNKDICHPMLQREHCSNVISEAAATPDQVLFIQDGSELLCNNLQWADLGPTADSCGNGIMFHSCLTVKIQNDQPQVLGLAGQTAWIRNPKKLAPKIQGERESRVWQETIEQIGPARRIVNG